MFWQKKKTTNWLLILFGFIALCIIVSVAVLIIIISVRVRQHSQNNLDSFKTKVINNFENITTPLLVKNQYQEDLNNLLNFVSSTSQSKEKVLAQTEDTFLKVRVPAEKKEEHLQAFLQFEKIKNDLGKLSEADLRKILSNLLTGLINE